jgi:hypothetical protein
MIDVRESSPLPIGMVHEPGIAFRDPSIKGTKIRLRSRRHYCGVRVPYEDDALFGGRLNGSRSIPTAGSPDDDCSCALENGGDQ